MTIIPKKKKEKQKKGPNSPTSPTTKVLFLKKKENGARDDGEVNDGKDRWTEGLTDRRIDGHKLKKKERKENERM